MDIYVINLEKRKDRWDKIKSKFKELNLIRVEAIENNIDGSIGCFQSHQKCIKIAKDKNLNKILVIEDDCDIMNLNTNEFIYLLKELDIFLNNLENWNILYGAGNKLKYENIINKISFETNLKKKFNIYEINFLKTSHFVWYNNTIYDLILNLDANKTNPIDRFWHGKFNSLVIIPFITTQIDDFSDIEKKKCSYTNSLKRYEKRLINDMKKKYQ